jgi:Protein of unknown function (DUF3515)
MDVGAVARLGLAGACAVLASCGAGAVPVGAAEPSSADREPCRDLLDALPDRVADQEVRTVEPKDAWAAAWGDPAIVLTCGVQRPQDFKRVSTCTTVNGVDWFIPEEQLLAGEPVDLTMTTVNREQYVEVLLPAEYWPPATALADLSGVVAEATEATGACV